MWEDRGPECGRMGVLNVGGWGPECGRMGVLNVGG